MNSNEAHIDDRQQRYDVFLNISDVSCKRQIFLAKQESHKSLRRLANFSRINVVCTARLKDEWWALWLLSTATRVTDLQLDQLLLLLVRALSLASWLIDGLADAVITSLAKTVEPPERHCVQLMTVDRGGFCVLSRLDDSPQPRRWSMSQR